MTKLTKAQIDELKEKGFITQVIPSTDLANNTVDDLKDDILITVTDPSADIEAAVTHTVPVSSISLSETQFICATGEDGSLIATVLPDNATDPTVTWTTSDSSIVSIVPGEDPCFDCEYLPTSTGIATITATAGDKSATCSITVATIELDKESTQLSVGDNEQLTATADPGDLEVEWTSDDPDKVSVDETGKITALEATDTPVTVTATIKGSSIEATCEVTVTSE